MKVEIFEESRRMRDGHEYIVKLRPVVGISFWVPVGYVFCAHEHNAHARNIDDTDFTRWLTFQCVSLDICFYVSLITVLSIWWILWPHDERNAVSICVVWCRDKQSRCCVSDVKILLGWRSVGSTKERSLNCVTSYGKTRIEPLTVKRTTPPMASTYSAVMYQSMTLLSLTLALVSSLRK
jgi:hypothetical protein